MKTAFLRVLQASDKAAALRSIVNGVGESRVAERFDVRITDLSGIPRSPFAYWASRDLLECYLRWPPFESAGRVARVTNPLGDNLRFVRTSWEAPVSGTRGAYNDRDVKWVPYVKGGAFRPFYDDPHLVVLWDFQRNSYHSFVGTPHRKLAKPASLEFFFRPGLTWPIRTNGLSFRVMAAGCVFGSKGPGAFEPSDDSEKLLALSSIANSKVFRELLGLQLARTELAQSYEVGLVQMTPVPTLSAADQSSLSDLALRSWRTLRRIDTSCETSHAFTMPIALQLHSNSFEQTCRNIGSALVRDSGVLESLAMEADLLCDALYGIDSSSALRRAEFVEDGTASKQHASGLDEEEDDDAGAWHAHDEKNLAARLVSWAVGVAVGRFDVRLATGDSVLPSTPNPFDPLPLCSPGMLTDEDGVPLIVVSADYPVDISSVLVTDPGHSLDASARVRSVFDVVFGPDADAWVEDVSEVLGGKGAELSAWLGRSFFDDHLRAYSKSRRRAPILWPVGTKSGSYLVWLYAHRVTSDSLFQVLHDVVAPKVALEDQRLAQLRHDASPAPSASQRRAIDQQAAFVDELRELAETIESLAPLWSPDLDDGVVVVLAPLWRLFAHHRAWSKELKAHWAKLASGDLDWAQLAMHLWPERVVPKCAEDRSLAIAHGLEDVFWVQDDASSEKWHPRRLPTEPVEQLIAQRHNPAVVAALAGQP